MPFTDDFVEFNAGYQEPLIQPHLDAGPTQRDLNVAFPNPQGLNKQSANNQARVYVSSQTYPAATQINAPFNDGTYLSDVTAPTVTYTESFTQWGQGGNLFNQLLLSFGAFSLTNNNASVARSISSLDLIDINSEPDGFSIERLANGGGGEIRYDVSAAITNVGYRHVIFPASSGVRYVDLVQDPEDGIHQQNIIIPGSEVIGSFITVVSLGRFSILRFALSTPVTLDPLQSVGVSLGTLRLQFDQVSVVCS